LITSLETEAAAMLGLGIRKSRVELERANNLIQVPNVLQEVFPVSFMHVSKEQDRKQTPLEHKLLMRFMLICEIKN
jgi:hypothetical protein